MAKGNIFYAAFILSAQYPSLNAVQVLRLYMCPYQRPALLLHLSIETWSLGAVNLACTMKRRRAPDPFASFGTTLTSQCIPECLMGRNMTIDDPRRFVRIPSLSRVGRYSQPRNSLETVLSSSPSRSKVSVPHSSPTAMSLTPRSFPETIHASPPIFEIGTTRSNGVAQLTNNLFPRFPSLFRVADRFSHMHSRRPRDGSSDFAFMRCHTRPLNTLPGSRHAYHTSPRATIPIPYIKSIETPSKSTPRTLASRPLPSSKQAYFLLHSPKAPHQKPFPQTQQPAASFELSSNPLYRYCL